MSSTASPIRSKQQQYEDAIINFISRDHGHIIALSDDQPFLTLLRRLLLKQFNLGNALTMVADEEQLLRVVKNRTVLNPAPIVFLERVMQGEVRDSLMRRIKRAYPGLRVIVVSHDVAKEHLALLHEIGADSFVAKPVSINTLVEKMAGTLKPQGRISQLIESAKAHLARNEPEAALELSRRILELKPDSAAGYLIRGDAHRQAGEVEIARESYEKAIEHAALFMDPLRRLGDLYGEMGDAEKRLNYLERMDKISPLNAERKVDMGEMHLNLGRTAVARALFDTAVEQIGRTDLSFITSRIATLCMDKEPALAEKYLRHSLNAKGDDLSREDLGIFNQLGINLRQQGRWQDALLEYERALRIAPDDENIHYNMGMANAEGHDYAAAHAHMEKALQINGDLPTASSNIAYNIGMIFMQAGNRAEAERHLRTALELNPGFESARIALERLR